jgi:release factor glutamine methyltransferase
VNLKEALTYARKTLSDNHIEDAFLEGEILLRHTLSIDRARLFAELDLTIGDNDFKTLKKLVARRAKGEPTAYIIGIKEFYGLDLIVNKHVLIPRPETELLVEQAIRLCRLHNYSTVADIGTGCGNIAISLAVNLPNIKVFATDGSKSALKVAKQNCIKHEFTNRITLLYGFLLYPLRQPVDMIVANLPYIPKLEIPKSGPLSFEPKIALNGGQTGVEDIEELIAQYDNQLNQKGSLLLEIGQGQSADVKTILNVYFPSGLIEVYKDLGGIERVVSLRLT